MKKIYLSIFTIVTLAAGLAACKKNNNSPGDNGTSNTPCQLSIDNYINNIFINSVKFSYGTGSQLISLNTEFAIFDYAYTDNQIILSQGGTKYYNADLSGGKVTKITSLQESSYYELSYNADGYLSGLKEYDNNKLATTFSYTYSGGNLATTTQTFTSNNATNVTTYKYSSETDKIGLLLDQLNNTSTGNIYIPNQYLGKHSTNVIKSSDYTFTNGTFIGKGTTTYTYTKGADGRFNAVTVVQSTTSFDDGKQTDNTQTTNTFKFTNTCK